MSTLLLQCCTHATEFMKCDCWHDATTNWEDVTIVAIICSSTLFVFWYAIRKTYQWQQLKAATAKERLNAEEEEKKDRRTTERTWQLEDQKRKKKTDLLEKKLQILKDLCYEAKDEESEKRLKAFNSEEVKNYTSEIDKELNSN